MASPPLVFTAVRREPVLIAPAEPTPHEVKPLSGIDDQIGLRKYTPLIHYYRNNPSMAGRDPVRTIRDAIAKALVLYYPLAGRLRDAPSGKLAVECTGEGVVFVEADAYIELRQFGDQVCPPFPWVDELLYGADRSKPDILHARIASFQVTRLKCGGFVVGYCISHSVADGAGVAQIASAIAEIARGADSPTVAPVWARELLVARDPPAVTHAHPAYDEEAAEPAHSGGDPALRMFFFGDREMAALRRHLPPRLQRIPQFEVLTASLWRCRTIALGWDPEEEVRLRFALNGRGKCSPPLPAGYYGNALAYPVAKATVGELSRDPLARVVERLRDAKASITEGRLQSSADFLVLRGRPIFTTARSFLVSDVTRLGFDRLDFGWGAPVYGGPAFGGGRVAPGNRSHYSRFRNREGEVGVMVPMILPAPAMERFAVEIRRMIEQAPATMVSNL